MPRSGKVKRVEVKSDPLYKSVLVSKLINRVMTKGKKSIAAKIVYDAMETLSADKTEARDTLKKAIDNVTPQLEVRPRRVGGATYQVPMPVRQERAESLALRWVVSGARSRKGMPMAKRLTLELKDALQNTGSAARKRDDMHRMAEANKAFAHFRW